MVSTLELSCTSDTAIYFCEMNASGSILKPLEIDDYGNNWPEKFFGDEIGDMTEAAIKRRFQSN